MYTPDHFKINDTFEIGIFVQEQPFGMLMNSGKQVPEVNHLPMRLLSDDSGKDSINMHFSKANPHAKLLENGKSAVAVFIGTNCYILPRWYAAKDNIQT